MTSDKSESPRAEVGIAEIPILLFLHVSIQNVDVSDRICCNFEKNLTKSLTQNNIKSKIGKDNSSRYLSTKYKREFMRLNDSIFFPLFGIALTDS